jgi:beta-galactosidase
MNTLAGKFSSTRSFRFWRTHGAALPVAIVALGLIGSTAFAAGPASPRERISLDAGWRFAKDDPADAAGQLAYTNIQDWVEATGMEFTTNADLAAKKKLEGNPGGGDISYAQSGFDDSQWRLLNLPHDWGVEGPFKQEYPGETGKLPWWGVAWYRKHLEVPASDQGKKIYLAVDGAMAYATVWLNSQFVGGWPYGYASWQVDLTPYTISSSILHYY